MFRSTTLSTTHYAGKWAIPAEDQRNDLKAINKLGYEYGSAEDSEEKERKLLQLLEAFHGYLAKYLVMILRGTMPQVNSPAGRDSRDFLRMLSPRGRKITPEVLNSSCKMLHLAFKQQTTEEVYDTLAFCFMRAARKYDPFYTNKVKTVCEGIVGEEEFTATELAARVGIDPAGILRSLVRKGYLASVIGAKRKVVGYKPVEVNWPPPKEFFESGPVGFVYVLQIWFKYYLNEHIVEQMGSIESMEAIFQLFESVQEVGCVAGALSTGHGRSDLIVRHPEGNCTNANGSMRFMADRSLMDSQLDVSPLSPAWVAQTNDKLFTELTPLARSILYMHFFDELSFKKIGKDRGPRLSGSDAGRCFSPPPPASTSLKVTHDRRPGCYSWPLLRKANPRNRDCTRARAGPSVFRRMPVSI